MNVLRKTVDNAEVVTIEGQIRISTQSEFEEFFNHLMEEESNHQVILNMSGIKYINSAGIGMIVDSFRNFKENGGRLVLCSLISDIEKLFEVTKLNRCIEIYPTEEEALRKIYNSNAH